MQNGAEYKLCSGAEDSPSQKTEGGAPSDGDTTLRTTWRGGLNSIAPTAICGYVWGEPTLAGWPNQ
jgi:hypothetical protein